MKDNQSHPEQQSGNRTMDEGTKSPKTSLDTLVDAAAAAEGSAAKPSEVTPATTADSTASTPDAAGKPAEASKPSTTSRKRSKLKSSESECPWKNRSDLLALWKKRYDQLVDYQAEHGDCNVPQRFAANPELGRWVKVSYDGRVHMVVYSLLLCSVLKVLLAAALVVHILSILTKLLHEY